MLKRILTILLTAALFLSLITTPAFGADLAKPHIAVDYAPAIGDGVLIDGYIWLSGGMANYKDYAITMALEVTRGGTVWGPKPTHAQPSVSIGSDGRFSCLFVTGGYDLYAERLYIWLIPSGFVPDSDFERTDAIALDKVIIDRYDNGKVEIKQTTPPPPPPVSSPTRNFPQQKHPKDTTKLSICYSPYTNGLSPETNSAVPIEQMRWQLNLIYPYVDTIRLFGVSGELEKIYKPAKEEYKM